VAPRTFSPERRRLTALRLTALGIAAPSAADAGAAVRASLAMQGQDYPGALWSLAVRHAAPVTEAALEEQHAAGAFVRSWPMRGTLHLIAREDLGWVLGLTGERMVRSAATRRAQLGLGEEDYARGEAIARSGATGAAIEQFWPLVPPHLHFSLLVDGVPIDPYACESDLSTPGFWAGGSPVPYDGTSALDLDLPMDMVSKDDVLAAFREDPVLGPNFIPPLSEIAPERFSHGPGWKTFTDRPLIRLSLPFRKRDVAGVWEG